MRDKILRVVRGTAVAAFWIGMWWGAALLVDQQILIPTPPDVLTTLGTLLPSGEFWQSVAFSLLRVVGGFAAALIVGTLLAVLTVKSQPVRSLFAPLLHIVRAAPVASFIILALVWMQYDIIPAFIAFLMVLPIVWVNVEEGIRRTDGALLEMMTAYGVSPWRRLTALYIPSVKPFFMTACVNGLGFAWKSGVAAEVICHPEWAIGSQLQDAKIYFETPEVFAWTAVVITLSIALERLLLRLASSIRKGDADGHA